MPDLVLRKVEDIGGAAVVPRFLHQMETEGTSHLSGFNRLREDARFDVCKVPPVIQDVLQPQPGKFSGDAVPTEAFVHINQMAFRLPDRVHGMMGAFVMVHSRKSHDGSGSLGDEHATTPRVSKYGPSTRVWAENLNLALFDEVAQNAADEIMGCSTRDMATTNHSLREVDQVLAVQILQCSRTIGYLGKAFFYESRPRARYETSAKDLFDSLEHPSLIVMVGPRRIFYP